MTSLGIAFAIYSIAIVGIGLAAARFKDRSNDDFFLAGRTLGPWLAAFSASASSSSGWTTIGLVGFAYINGTVAYWIFPGVLFGFIFNWVVIAPRLQERAGDLQALTVPDLFAWHFAERLPILRLMSVVVILVAMFLYVAAQLAAAGLAFQASFSTVSFPAGVIIGTAYVLLYTVAGGFRASVWTDAAQFMVMIAALVGLPLYLLAFHIDLASVRDGLASIESRNMLGFLPSSATQSGMALVGFLLGSGALGINLGYPGQPHVLVRFMAMRNRKDARIGLGVSIVWAFLTVCGAVSIGLIVRAMIANGGVFAADATTAIVASEGENALIVAASSLLPGIFAGIMLAGVLSAICSTADSQLIVAASAVASDIYVRLFDKRSMSNMLINRLVILALGVGAAILVIADRGEIKVYSYVLEYGWAVLGAAFGPQLILLLTWKRATYAGCIAGMATGFIVAIAWKNGYPSLQKQFESLADIQMYNLTVAFIAAFCVNTVVSLLTRPPSA